MKESFFEERGISYRTNEFQGGRPTLVWIHGLSGSISAWYTYEARFSPHYNLVTFDLRGHGRSARPRHYADYALPVFADDLDALLKHLHIDKCVLISHSFGTLIALEFVTAHSENVSGIVFLSPTSFLKKTRWSFFVRTVGRGLVALCAVTPFRTTMRGRVDYAKLAYTSDWDLRRVVRDVYITTIHAYLYCLAQTYAKDYDGFWKRIAVPTLIIHGTGDTYIPVQHSMMLAKEISGSALVTLQGANHIIILNNAAEVSEHIEHFLNSHTV